MNKSFNCNNKHRTIDMDYTKAGRLQLLYVAKIYFTSSLLMHAAQTSNSLYIFNSGYETHTDAHCTT